MFASGKAVKCVRSGAALALFGVTVVACLAFDRTAAKAATATIKIPIAVSLTGSSALIGQSSFKGATLAVEEANRGAGHAPAIELVPYDDRTNAFHAQEIAHDINATDAVVVIGPATSQMALAAAPVYNDLGIVCVGATATADSLSNYETFFRPIFSAGDAGETLANYLKYIFGGTRATILTKDDGYGRAVATRFAHAADRLGIQTTQRLFDTLAQGEAAARLVAHDPDRPAIVLAMIYEGADLLKVLRREGTQTTVLGTNTIAGEAFSARFKDEPEEQKQPGYFTDGVYATSPTIFDSANAETLAFAERFRARFGHEPDYVAAQAYESAKLAIAAVRAAPGKSMRAQDLPAHRQAVQTYLVSLDGPANAIAGLNGSLWFTPEHGRQEALRIGRFQSRRFESAPEQLVPIHNFDAAEVASGAVVDTGSGNFARRQQVVYTGIYLNEISRVDVGQSTFTADFYLWVRYTRNVGAGAADPTEIDFPEMVRGNFDPTKPTRIGDLDDGTTYRLWRIRGDFKNHYDLHRYPFDQQDLVIRMFNARADSERIAYVQDKRSVAAEVADADPGGSLAFKNVAPEAFHNLTQWQPLRIVEERDNTVTQSALGDPRLVGLERVLELSGFRVTIILQRLVASTLAKSLLPLGLLTLIMFVSLYFPAALVKEKIAVAVSAALAGAVLLTSINGQLGAIGYVIAVEYLFYAFFTLCFFCILSVLAAERFRGAKRDIAAAVVEHSVRASFLLTAVGTALAAWLITWRF